MAQFFATGISEGFKIRYSTVARNCLKPARKNLSGALEHPEVVDEYLKKELPLNRVASPFNRSQPPSMHISRFGVISKSHQKDKWRLIIDLLHPKYFSVSDSIPKSLCGLSYITVDDAIKKILELGPITSLAKADIKSTFRLLPVTPLTDTSWAWYGPHFYQYLFAS